MREEQGYRIGRLGGGFAIKFPDPVTGKRRRHRLVATDAGQARLAAPGAYAHLTRPKSRRVDALWQAYVEEMQGRAVTATMPFAWRVLRDRFGHLEGDAITIRDCDAHVEQRRAAGIKDGTIHTELGRLRMVLLWAVRREHLAKASYIKRPSPPKRREDVALTREQVRALIAGASMPHVRLAIILFYTTAARSAALCGLTWARCDFERGTIDLRDPTMTRPHKGRALVPMLRTARAALLEAKAGRLTDYVIEWGGEPVKSLKRGLATAARTAGIDKKVSPHVIRHSAAVHMVEDGVSMDEVQQWLGHEDISTTRQIYARYSPTYLAKAAAALEFDDLAPTAKRRAG